MKTLLAAALVVSGHSQDETSLMQGLARRVEGKLGADGNSKRHDTAKLMETATKMLKNGAGVTPDVVTFIEETLDDLNGVLTPITDAHRSDQARIADIVSQMDAAVATYQAHCDLHEGTTVVDYRETNQLHKECRQLEAHKCGESRECEVELETLWQVVKREEEKMREIHSRIHTSWCVDLLDPPHGERTCFDPNACWHWNEERAMEGPETSQTLLSYDNSFHYPIADYSTAVSDFRSLSVTTFEEYIEQKRITELAWEAYNSKIVICADLSTALEVQVASCDLKQDDIASAICSLSNTDRTARRVFGLEWKRLNDLYDETVGFCTNPAGVDCDIHALQMTSGSTFENAAVDLSCSCTEEGIRQLEFDRKREWETLKIVQCLLTTVYTHVVHSIETGEPCPTTETHQEQTESEINHCHTVELELTANLTIDYCGDDLPLECPEPPQCELPEPEKCSAEYLWDTQGHFGSFMDSFVPNLPVHSQLSTAGWGSCAAPKACIPCAGSEPDLPDPAFDAPSAQCLEAHQMHLLPGESDKDTFRCQGTWCLPMAGRCNGHSNCGDGSDEVGCVTAWEIPQWLAVNDVCRAGANVVAGEQDDVQFFCNDGSCIAVEGRCNGHSNCADGSDEAACPTNADGVTVETSTGLPATLETITVGARVFHDREYTFKSIGSFTGIKMVKISNDDKDISQNHVAMKLRLQQPTSVYIVTTSDNTLDWLYRDGWTQVTALTGLEYSGPRMTPHKRWSAYTFVDAPDQIPDLPLVGSTDQFDAIDREQQHYGPGHVWEKTFPAGVVSLNGNGGGSGYDWSQPVEGGHGSYLTFVAHPSNPPSPVVEPVVFDTRLTAYWDSGACGPHGDDHNWGWCGQTAGNCPEEVTVDSSICASNTAVLHTMSGTGQCCSSVVIDGCNYAYHAQYVCSDAPTFNYGAMFTNSCPGSPVSQAECLDAAQSLLGSGQNQGRTSLVSGSWGWVPPGCSVQSHFTHNQNGDFAAHYNSLSTGNNDGGYTPVCATECQHLTNQDVVGGTFAHYGLDHTDSASDAACSASCTLSPECTAWVRQPSTGNCWISNQRVVTFEADSDRTTGLRCN